MREGMEGKHTPVIDLKGATRSLNKETGLKVVLRLARCCFLAFLRVYSVHTLFAGFVE